MTPELIQTLMYAAFALAGYFLNKWLGPNAPKLPLPTLPNQPPTVIGALADEVQAKQVQAQREQLANKIAEFLTKPQ